jgi:hypothetical protein
MFLPDALLGVIPGVLASMVSVIESTLSILQLQW